MKAKDVVTLSTTELEQKAKTLKEELFNLKFQLSLGQLANTAKIREVRRDVARINTTLRGRKLESKEV